jgi:hypothetical protein
MSALFNIVRFALSALSACAVQQSTSLPPEITNAIGPSDVAAAITGESPARIRIARGDSALNVIVVKRSGGIGEVAEYDCGPAWVVWPGGEAPEIDARLWALPFCRLALKEPSRGAEGPMPSSRDGVSGNSIEPQLRPRLLVVGSEMPYEPAQVARCGPILTPIEPELRSQEIVVWWSLAKVAAVHRRAIDGLALAKSLAARRQTPEFLAADADSRIRLIAPFHASAALWIDERLDAPPPIGNAAIAWIELMDARQSLLRADDRVSEADAVVRDLQNWLVCAKLPRLVERLGERVPRGAVGFASLCDQPCWIFDAGEVAAASQRLMAEQHAACDAIQSEISRLQPCSQEFVTEIKERLKLLVGQLPNGVRVTARMRDLMRARLDEYCGLGPLAAERTLARDYAATVALEIWTEAWIAASERSGDAEAMRVRWRTQLTELMTRTVQDSPAYSSVINIADRRRIVDEVSRMIQRQFDGGSNYLTAFAGDRFTLARIENEWRTVIGERDPAALGQILATSEHALPPGSAPEDIARAEQLASQAAVQMASQEVFGDLMQAMFMALTEADASKPYPEPFPMRYASVRMSGERVVWRIGLD